MPTPIDAKDRLIVALDLPSIKEAEALVERLDGTAEFFKVGLTLQLAEGSQAFVTRLLRQNKKVFLDYKYFDIEETIRIAVKRAADLGVTFLTVHGNAEIIKAAAAGRGSRALKVLCVTVLTVLDAADIQDLGFPCAVDELVLHRAKKALEYGCDGVIASGREAHAIRTLAGKNLLIVTPGIRPPDSSKDEHKRATSPSEAIVAGADYLVVGRPITSVPDPVQNAKRIVAEMQDAFTCTAKTGTSHTV